MIEKEVSSIRTSTLLSQLAQRRYKKPLDCKLDMLFSKLISYNKQMPKFCPPILDRTLLMMLGMDEVQCDSLLAIWEAGGEIPLWGNGTTIDLCHELDLTSYTIRYHLKPLESLGIIKFKAKDRSIWVTALKPIIFGNLLAKSLCNTATELESFFNKKENETKDRNLYKFKFFQPKDISIRKELKRQLIDLANNNNKMQYGVITTTIEKDTLELNEYHSVNCRSGPKLHLYPDFNELHRVKRYLENMGKSPMIEFHTHSSNTDLHEKDIDKMKMLRRGYWVIGTKEKLNFYYFYHKNKNNSKDMLTLVTESLEL